MKPVFKITFENGDKITTSMAEGRTLEDAKDYYLGNYFNPGIGPEERPAVKAVKVEQLEPSHVLHGDAYFESISEEEHEAIGQEIARVLHLKQVLHYHSSKRGIPYNPPRYETTHGSKTAIGLSRTIASLFTQGTRNFASRA